jgi:hypothetical protein
MKQLSWSSVLNWAVMPMACHPYSYRVRNYKAMTYSKMAVMMSAPLFGLKSCFDEAVPSALLSTPRSCIIGSKNSNR